MPRSKMSKDELTKKLEEFAILKASLEDIEREINILEGDILFTLKDNKNYSDKSFIKSLIVNDVEKNRKLVISIKGYTYRSPSLFVSEVVE